MKVAKNVYIQVFLNSKLSLGHSSRSHDTIAVSSQAFKGMEIMEWLN